MGLEVDVGGVALSPDGTRAITLTARKNYEENRYEQSLFLVDLASGSQKELTPHRPGVGPAAWSPSGKRIAFVDTGVEGEARQVFILPMDGGEARQVTKAADGVRSFHWSADGSHIYYTTRDTVAVVEGEERHNKSFEVGDNSYLTQAAPLPAHLWSVPADGGEAKRLTEGPESVSGFVVSPDGRRVALEVMPLPHSGEGIRTFIRLLDLSSGESQELDLPRPAYPIRFSPDGRYLAVARPRGPEPYFHPDGIFLIPSEGGEEMDVTGEIDRDLGGMAFLPHGKAILVNGTDLTARAFWLQPIGGPPQRLDLGDIHPSGPQVSSDGTVVFMGREDLRSSELYTMKVGEWEPRRLTHFNDALAEKRLGEVETVTWDGPDGFRQNGVLLYPPDYEEGRRYPLVLYIHGGPMGASTEAFSIFNHILAAQGWLVFSPNYRGSSTQGKAFQSAVVNDAGEGPGRDVMSGIQVLKDRGIVDESRIAVSGWSYGGYMTAWLTAHYDGWKVAMAGAAVTDWFDWYNMADMNTWAGFGLGGSPWLNDNAMNYWRQSPMAYAHQIRTPTLILSTTGDERVTVSQSYKLYHALKDNGVEVQFIAYPVPGHFPSDPVHQRDIRRRWVEWIANHFQE
jgi:dipeptidyl aminopeptidase/acylaminoacyl peptidase